MLLAILKVLGLPGDHALFAKKLLLSRQLNPCTICQESNFEEFLFSRINIKTTEPTGFSPVLRPLLREVRARAAAKPETDKPRRRQRVKETQDDDVDGDGEGESHVDGQPRRKRRKAKTSKNKGA